VPNYQISSEALFDIAEIWRYIARDSFDLADLVEEAIYSNCFMVAKNPQIGHKRTDLTAKPVRFWPVLPYEKYLLVYDPDLQPVQIVRVVHAARRKMWRSTTR
jgi:plasmid stabilization system protein ParE